MAALRARTPIDHSLTYRIRSLRNLPHRLRLRVIERAVGRLDLGPEPTYADFGCSNGYVTERVRELIGASRAWGFDRVEAHLERGRAEHPEIEFSPLDLNHPNPDLPRCDLVTCFETLEHVGNLKAALDNVLRAVRPGGVALITVPIEVGAIGLVKFAAKMAYGYDLSSLPQVPGLRWRYVAALLTGARIGVFRDQRQGWGTHFGFDYRDLNDALERRGVRFRAWTSGTTRFYHVRTTVD